MLPQEIIDGIPVLRPKGRFDSYQVAAIDASMEAIVAESDMPCVVVNFMEVHFLDAASIDALFKWRETFIEKGGDIKLSSLRHTVRMSLNIHHLVQFRIYEDDAQAIADFDNENNE
ncbi:MAG: STAS domain-containing protein [Anaerolineae bacterium]|nr:STAS domain-containing protein [Anaerolineae bacterium]MDQ7035641.1 STAS domain-containing protein [Anaerolineae bacterium]